MLSLNESWTATVVLVDDLEKSLPRAVTAAAIRAGNELVFSFGEAELAIRVAGEHLIAVLGIEAFRILDVGIQVETYTGYEFKFEGEWKEFVRLNNDAAFDWMARNPLGEGYGYILTATSEEELKRLPKVFEQL